MTQDTLPLILAVDDERANLMLLERLLREHYRVISVTSGEQALGMLVQAPFDLVLLDVMMPIMNGLETLRHIRSNPDSGDVPIVLISALSDTKSISEGLEAGANDYITKPIDADVTLARVQTQILLKQLNDQRKQTINELRAAQETKNRLIRIASHDLKGPLNNIRMANMLMKRYLENVPDSAELIEATEASLDTMHMVIKDFLDTAALETAVLDLNVEGLRMLDSINDVTAEHRVNAVRKNITVEIGETEGVIRADHARFQQCLGNLVSNAIKYGPANSNVRIWTECQPGSVTVCVADQGAGIPADEQHKLFTQFGKLSPRPTGGEASTGMGLWIVKHLVNLQGGEVGMVAPPEGGSLFWIRMPAA